MKTAADFYEYIQSCSQDIDENDVLRVSTLRKGLVYYWHKLNRSRKDFKSATDRLVRVANKSAVVKEADVNQDAFKHSVKRLINDVLKKKKSF